MPQGATAGDFWAVYAAETHEATFHLSALEQGMIFFELGQTRACSDQRSQRSAEKKVFAFEPCSLTLNF